MSAELVNVLVDVVTAGGERIIVGVPCATREIDLAQPSTAKPTATIKRSSSPQYPMPCHSWIGGKRHLVPHVLSLLPARIRTFRSPFLGAGAVELAALSLKRHDHAVLSDVNAWLIRQWGEVCADPAVVHADLLRLEERQDHAEARRELNRGGWSPGLLAWIVTRSFSGMFRVNRSGKFNAPYDAAKKRPLPGLARLELVRDTVAGARISCRDFLEALPEVEEGDVQFLDPPYINTFDGYSACGWGVPQVETLFDGIRLAQVKGATSILTETVEILPWVEGLTGNVEVLQRAKGHVMNGARKIKQMEVIVTVRP